MRRGKIYDWLPLWRNKWLMGSTRWELDPGERSVFIDFLCLAGADDGYIRANPTTPYPLEYLAGMLQAPLELISRTIEKCVAVGKLTRSEDGILFISSWKDYQLDPRRRRELMQEGKVRGREENLDLDDTERSGGNPAQIRRVLGGSEDSALDSALDRALAAQRREAAQLEAELKRKEERGGR